MNNKKFFVRITKNTFTLPRKVGLDSSVIITLIDNPDLFFRKEMEIFKKKDLFFTHRICIKESTNVLSEKARISKNEAFLRLYQFLASHNIKEIRTFIKAEEMKEFIEKCKHKNIACHESDAIILLAFKKFGINKVYSADGAFLSAAREAGIEAKKFPTEESELSRILGEMYRKKKKII